MYPLFVKKVCIDWNRVQANSYLNRIPALKDVEEIPFRSPVTYFAGENGTGKSTLLEGIAVAYGFNPEGGSRNYSFSTYDTHSELWEAITLVRGIRQKKWGYFLRAESFYNVASEIERLDREPGIGGRVIDSYGGRSLPGQSHGESFMALAFHRFGPRGLYLLDEPEAALSPQNQMGLLVRIRDLVEEGSQFIIATHSPLLMAFPGSTIYLIDEEGLHLTPYEQTPHYQLTRSFLENPERMLGYLFQE